MDRWVRFDSGPRRSVDDHPAWFFAVADVAAHGGVDGHLVAAPEVGLLQRGQVTGECAVQGPEEGAAGDRCG